MDGKTINELWNGIFSEVWDVDEKYSACGAVVSHDPSDERTSKGIYCTDLLHTVKQEPYELW